jgi:hypothetical protein
MTDQRRRIIERAALTGDPSAASALLTQRMRDGSLTRERLELAAFCGDEAALCAFACRHDDIADGDRGCVCWYGGATSQGPNRRQWAVRLSRKWRAPVAARAAVELGHAVLAATDSAGHEGCDGDHRRERGTIAFSCAALAEAIRQAEHWLVDPCFDRLDGCLGGGVVSGMAYGVNGGISLPGALLAYAMDDADHWLAGSGADSETVVRQSLIAWSLGGSPT